MLEIRESECCSSSLKTARLEILSLLGERVHGFHQIFRKIYDPKTKSPNLGEHLSHPLDLQRSKLRPGRGWYSLREVQSIGEMEPGLR